MSTPASTPPTPYATLLGFTRYVARTARRKATFVGGLRRQRERRSGFNPHGQLVKALKADIAFRTGGSYLNAVVDLVKPRWQPLYEAVVPGATTYLHSLGDPKEVGLAQTRDALAMLGDRPSRSTPSSAYGTRTDARGGPTALRRGAAERGGDARHPAPDGPAHGRGAAERRAGPGRPPPRRRPPHDPAAPARARSSAGWPARRRPSGPSGPPPPDPFPPPTRSRSPGPADVAGPGADREPRQAPAGPRRPEPDRASAGPRGRDPRPRRRAARAGGSEDVRRRPGRLGQPARKPTIPGGGSTRRPPS